MDPDTGRFSNYLPFHPSESFMPNDQCVENSSQLHPIGTIPDDILLKIFKFFADEMYAYYARSEKWRTLVHVCRRWRQLAFTSPRHLNLELFCRPPRRSVDKMLDVWPELPVYLHAFDYPKKGRDKVVAALKLNHRVSGIRLEKTSARGWETFAPLMQQPFPVLTHLCVQPRLSITNPIPRSFLGGSAPCLRDLVLVGVPLPELPELLLSATNLTRLWYNDVPLSGYIPPQAMITGLSALTRLESLSLTTQSPRALADRAIRIPPPHTRTLLPALTDLRFQGVSQYMEVLATQIDASLLESLVITFHRGVLEVSELAKLIRRADQLSLVDRAEVILEPDCISVKRSEELLVGKVDPNTLVLNPACGWDFHPLNFAKFCASFFPTYSPFERLQIDYPLFGQGVVDDHQWLELLCPFNTMKHLRLSGPVTSCVLKALKGLPVERVTEVLPALEVIFIPSFLCFGFLKEEVSEFVDARQLSGHPVSVHGWGPLEVWPADPSVQV